MNISIRLGARGWRHAHWQNTFYPEDLPQDWQLTYYSNVFNTVLVPADYWQIQDEASALAVDCDDWLEDVHDDFVFYVECHAHMFEFISLAALSRQLQKLKPQLSGLVFLDDKQRVSNSVKDQFRELIDVLAVDVYGASVVLGGDSCFASKNIWQQSNSLATAQSTDFAVIQDDLSDLKSARVMVDRFAACIEVDEKNAASASIIIDHAKLPADNLSKFRCVLEIMGF